MAGLVAAAFSCAIIASMRLLSIPPIFMLASQTNSFRLSEYQRHSKDWPRAAP
jgi:hypothetical protein